MSRDPYRSSGDDLRYGGRGTTRWDMDRFTTERDRYRNGYEERDTRVVDDVYERRGPRGGYEEDRFREKVYYDDVDDRYRDPPPFRGGRRESVTIEREKEREYINASPPRRAPRPGLIRRQSSLDTFDRVPFRGFQREEYGPPARRADYRPEPLPPIPLPRSRGLPAPRRYAERDYEEIKIAEPDFYGDDDYRGYPERIREREVIRTRRRSRSRGSRVRSSSVSSSSSGTSAATIVKSEFPKRGKTRMPKRLVNKRAIIDLGYPFEEEGSTIIILKALGRENIDEVIKLSEDYKISEKEMSRGRSHGQEVIEERRTTEVDYRAPLPPPPPPVAAPQIFEVSPEDIPREAEIVEKTTVERREEIPGRLRSRSVGPVVYERDRREIIERDFPAGPLVLRNNGRKDELAITAEIKALEAEKEALRAERRAQRELERAARIRTEGRESGELIIYEEKKKEREHDGGVRIEKDKRGPDPRAVRTLLKTLT